MVAACKQEYPLPKNTSDLSLLVVEGLLNSGPGGTMVRLSRTFNPTDIATVVPELQAQVTVEGDNNTTFSLTGNAQGQYTHSQLNLNTNAKYRLRIITVGGQEYLSEYVSVQASPTIDSVYWQRTNEAIQFFVTTHDPQNKTWYYRWEYDETWEINSDFISLFRYVEPDVVPRADPYSIYYCWKHESSARIFLNSSAKLSEDVISAQPLHSIPIGTERIGVRYSVIVRQYALTEEAFEFWDILKKNTEQVGTLFDPQPSQLLSNIHSVKDPAELVIGYVSAGSISEKRIFVRRNEVHPWNYITNCTERVIPLDSIQFYFPKEPWIPLREWYIPGGRLGGYYSSIRTCVDCTTRGTNVRPSFW